MNADNKYKPSLRPAQLSASKFLEENSRAVLIAPVGWGKTLSYINAAVNVGGKVVVGVSEYEAVPDVVATIKALRPDATVVCPVGQTKTKTCSHGNHIHAFAVKQGDVLDKRSIDRGCVYHKLIAAIPSADFVVSHHAFIREHLDLFTGFDTLVLDEFDEALRMQAFLFARYRETGKHVNYEGSDFDVILEGLKNEAASTRDPQRIKSINRTYSLVRNLKTELFANTIADVEQAVERAVNKGKFGGRFRPNAVHLSLEDDAKRWAKLAVFTAPDLSFLNYYPSTRNLYEVLKNVKQVTYRCKWYSPNYADLSGYIEIVGLSSDTSLLNAGFEHVWLISATEPPFQLEDIKEFATYRVKGLDVFNPRCFVTSYATDDELAALLEEFRKRNMNTVFVTRKKKVNEAKRRFKLNDVTVLHFGKKTRSVNLTDFDALVVYSPEEREDRILPKDDATAYHDAIARKVLQAVGRVMRYPFSSYKIAVIPKRYFDEVKKLAPYYRYVDLHACPLPVKGKKRKSIKIPILLHAEKGKRRKGEIHASVGADGRLSFRPPKGYEIIGGEIILRER